MLLENSEKDKEVMWHNLRYLKEKNIHEYFVHQIEHALFDVRDSLFIIEKADDSIDKKNAEANFREIFKRAQSSLDNFRDRVYQKLFDVNSILKKYKILSHNTSGTMSLILFLENDIVLKIFFNGYGKNHPNPKTNRFESTTKVIKTQGKVVFTLDLGQRDAEKYQADYESLHDESATKFTMPIYSVKTSSFNFELNNHILMIIFHSVIMAQIQTIQDVLNTMLSKTATASAGGYETDILDNILKTIAAYSSRMYHAIYSKNLNMIRIDSDAIRIMKKIYLDMMGEIKHDMVYFDPKVFGIKQIHSLFYAATEALLKHGPGALNDVHIGNWGVIPNSEDDYKFVILDY